MCVLLFFFFNDTATTEIYTLSLHDALPICRPRCWSGGRRRCSRRAGSAPDRKSTRLNSSHANISYAVFCLKKKNNTAKQRDQTYKHTQPSHQKRKIKQT